MPSSPPSGRPWRSSSLPTRRSNRWPTRCARSSRAGSGTSELRNWMHSARVRRSAPGSAEARLGLLLAAPAIATIVLIAVIPLAGTIQDSLFQISLKFENAPRPFVGLDNYRSALGDEGWFNALRVTGLVAGVSVAAELVLGMIIALLINRSFRGRGLVRASVLVPWALTTVVSAKMWAWIFDGRYGVANDLLLRLGAI